MHTREVWKTRNFQLFTNKINPWKDSDNICLPKSSFKVPWILNRYSQKIICNKEANCVQIFKMWVSSHYPGVSFSFKTVRVTYILKFLRISILVVEYEFLPEWGDAGCTNRDSSVSQDINFKGWRVIFTSYSLIFYWKLLTLIGSHECLAAVL